MNLQTALASLDALEDEHWTSDGLPRMDVLVERTGDGTLKRKIVTDAAPSLTRAFALEQVGKDDTDDDQGEDLETEAAAATEEDPQGGQQPEQEQAAPAALRPEPEVVIPTLPGLEPGHSVLDLQRVDVIRSPDLTEAALLEIEEKIIETQRRETAIAEELKQLYAKNELLKRAQVMHSRNRPKGEQKNAIQQYLAAQQAARALRAKRAQVFISGGTTPADVADALRTTSKLDAAMRQRNPARGSLRPAALPVR